MKKEARIPPKARDLLWRALPVMLLLQLISLAVAGGVFIYILNVDLTKEFYSAHRNLKSTQSLLMPAALTAGVLGFLLVALVTWLGFRYVSLKMTSPVIRTHEMLEKVARGDFTHTPTVMTSREMWALDDSAEKMLGALSERIEEMQRISKELQNAILSLRYKATADEPLTLKELREAARALENRSKQLASSLKWFET